MNSSDATVSTSAAAHPPASPVVRIALWSLLVLVLAGAFVAWAMTWDTGVKPGLLPVGSVVPDFTLTERSGMPLGKSDLLGKVWVANFVFTRCSGPCPTLSARMQRLQLHFKNEPHVRLVTFSLDPTVDTPAVLSDYAKRFHADPQQWLFLTSEKESTMHDLVKSGFFQTVIPASDGKEMIHSEYLVLIDAKGHIRSPYLGTNFDNQRQLVADIRKLLSEI
jgi:cytochrome oxidase Cu insertion factor (SCO1/SenC/PrrC family)